VNATPGVAAARCATASAPRERPDVRFAGARAWFASQGHVPFDFQEAAWAAFTDGRSGLLHAPTGMTVPRGATATDLDRLDALVLRTGSRRLVVLGDFIHAAKGRVPAFGRLTGLALVPPARRRDGGRGRRGDAAPAATGGTLRPEPRGHGRGAPDRRPAGDRSSAGRLLKNLWISGGKYVHSHRAATQKSVLTVVFGPPRCAPKRPCHSGRWLLFLVLSSSLNTRCSRF
jgi:hypothetical protein